MEKREMKRQIEQAAWAAMGCVAMAAVICAVGAMTAWGQDVLLCEGSARLTWPANPDSELVAAYQVLRATDVAGPYEMVATTPGDVLLDENGQPVMRNGRPVLFYDDMNLAEGTYYYKLAAVDQCALVGAQSGASNMGRVPSGDGPSAPTGLTVTATITVTFGQ